MDPRPDCGEKSYRGTAGWRARSRSSPAGTAASAGPSPSPTPARVPTRADLYLTSTTTPRTRRSWVEKAGRQPCWCPVTSRDPAHCRAVIDRAVEEFGRVDVLVNNAAFQMSHETLEEIPDEEWDHTFATNVSAMFHLVKAALPHMQAGASIIGSSSVNSDAPARRCALRRHQGRHRELLASLAQLLGDGASGPTASRPARSGRR